MHGFMIHVPKGKEGWTVKSISTLSIGTFVFFVKSKFNLVFGVVLWNSYYINLVNEEAQ
jgi:hypothetical protein